MHRILYLGIDPSRYVYDGLLTHCPIIQTIPAVLDEETKRMWPLITHVLFTSRSAVTHWPLPLAEKVVLSIGHSTSASLPSPSLIAPSATQEGVIALLEKMDLLNAFILWPRSSRSRSLLLEYFAEQKIHVHVFDLYTTCLRRPEVLPDLSLFDEIVFTSPSTVEAFLELYGSIPAGKKITPIGPVTAKTLQINI